MDLISLAKKKKGIWPERIEKTTINSYDIMPLNVRTVIVTEPGEALKACKHIRMYGVIGLDTETKATFTKGEKNQVALVQIAIPGVVYLFRVNILGFPDALWDILEDESITKVGMGLKSDWKQLRALRNNFKPRGIVDIGVVAKAGGVVTFGLRNLVGVFFKQRLPKTYQLSNWEDTELSEGQVTYAARDAWACLILFYEMTSQLFVS